MTGCMDQRLGDPPSVRPIEPARRIPQVDREAVGDAGGDTQHLGLARRAGKASALERCERRRPVDERHRCFAWFAVDHLDGLGDEVAPLQPIGVVDQQLDGGFSAEEPLGVLSQRGCKVLEAGSK